MGTSRKWVSDPYGKRSSAAILVLKSSAAILVLKMFVYIFQCGTILGQPDIKHTVGQTQIPYDIFIDYLMDLSKTTFRYK